MPGFESIMGYGTAPASASSGLASPLQLLSDGSYDVSSMANNGLVAMPNVPGIGGGLGSGLGMNLDTLKLGLSGIATIGNIYAALQANKLAKKQFNFSKKAYNANMANSIQSYNTTLADRLNSRAKVEGSSDDQAAAEIAANSLQKTVL